MCLLACMDHVGFSESIISLEYFYLVTGLRVAPFPTWRNSTHSASTKWQWVHRIQLPPKKWPIDFQPEESSVIKKRFSFCAYASACFCFRFIIYLGIARELAVMNECIGHRYMSTMCTMCFWTTLAPPQQKKPNDIGEGGSNLPSFNHLFHTHLQVSPLQKQRNNKKHGLFHGDGLSIHLPPPTIMKGGLR